MADFFQASPGWVQVNPQWLQSAAFVSDTDVIPKPLDAVLAKRIRMQSSWTEFERVPGAGGVKIIGKASGVGSFSDAAPSFTVKSSKRGY